MTAMKRPDWLPDMVSVNGEWRQVLARLYAIFDKDLKQVERRFEGRPVRWDHRILGGDLYEEGFWHLITKTDQQTNQRLFDPRRAERLPWCGPTITHSEDPVATVWDFREANGRLRTYVWLADWDYVIVLEKRPHRVGEMAFLVTAFHVDGESRRRNLQNKCAQRAD